MTWPVDHRVKSEKLKRIKIRPVSINFCGGIPEPRETILM
jgi:hypothetical protein